MIDLIKMVLGPVIKFAFGSGARIKITLALIAISLFGVGVWYVTNKYADLEVKAAELEIQLKDCRGTSNQLRQNLLDKQTEFEAAQNRFEEVLKNRQILEGEFKQLERDKETDLEVFNKECGRLDRLMQKKASLVVRAANRANKRLRERFEAATRADDSN